VHERYKKKVYEDGAMLDQRHAATNANVILLVFLGLLRVLGGFGPLPSSSLASDPSAKLGTFETSLKKNV
jgi:hypothetical protein